ACFRRELAHSRAVLARRGGELSQLGRVAEETKRREPLARYLLEVVLPFTGERRIGAIAQGQGEAFLLQRHHLSHGARDDGIELLFLRRLRHVGKLELRLRSGGRAEKDDKSDAAFHAPDYGAGWRTELGRKSCVSW